MLSRTQAIASQQFPSRESSQHVVKNMEVPLSPCLGDDPRLLQEVLRHMSAHHTPSGGEVELQVFPKARGVVVDHCSSVPKRFHQRIDLEEREMVTTVKPYVVEHCSESTDNTMLAFCIMTLSPDSMVYKNHTQQQCNFNESGSMSIDISP